MLLKSLFREMFESLDIRLQRSEWPLLMDVAEVIGGSTPKTANEAYWNGPNKWITPAEIYEDSIWINDTERSLTDEGVASCALKKLPVGTVLLTSRAPIGKVAIAGCEMYCNQGFKNLICSSKVIPEYLYFLLKHNADYLNSLGRGATFKEISKSIVEKIRIPVPPISVQQQFVSIAQQVEKTKATLNAMLEKISLLKKAKFKEMFGHERSVVKLRDCCEIHARIGWQALTQKEHQKTGDYMLITGTDFLPSNSVDFTKCVYVTKERYKMDPHIILQDNDILVTKDGTIGKVAIVKNLPKPATLNSGIFVIRPDNRFDKNYIAAVFKGSLFSYFVDNVKTGATIKHLNQKTLLDFQIPVPSLDKQRKYADFIQHLDKTKATLECALEDLS